MTDRIRWRLNDPSEEPQPRWTKAHYQTAPYVTACHIKIPEWPYDVDTNEQIPDDVEVCKRCVRRVTQAVTESEHAPTAHPEIRGIDDGTTVAS